MTSRESRLTAWRFKFRIYHTGDLALLDALTMLTIVLVVMASRVFFRTQILYHWDSINFAFGMRVLDIMNGQPHVPGYILYIWFMRLVNLLFRDPQSSMVAVSMVSSAAAVAGIYYLGRVIANWKVGILSAVLLGSSPLFWFYGEIALPHALDTFMVIFTMGLLYNVWRGDRNLALYSAIWLGIVGGFRPQTQIFLLPLAVFAYWNLDRKTQILSLIAMGVVDILWLIPLVSSAGGLASYWEIFWNFYSSFNTDTSIFEGAGLSGLIRNLRKLIMYSLYAMGFSMIPLVLPLVTDLPEDIRKKTWYPDARIRFLITAAVPSILYYTFLHMGQQGLVFVFLAPLLLITAWYFQHSSQISFSLKIALPGAVVAANAILFIFAPMYPFGEGGIKLLTVDTLRSHDRYYQDRIQFLSTSFDPDRTLLLSSEWRFPQYYLPDYPLLRYALVPKGEVNQGMPLLEEDVIVTPREMGIPAGPQTEMDLVVFDDNLLPLIHSDFQIEELVLSDGNSMFILRINPNQRIQMERSGLYLLKDGIE